MCLRSTQWICLSSYSALVSERSLLIWKLNFSVIEPPDIKSEWSMSPVQRTYIHHECVCVCVCVCVCACVCVMCWPHPEALPAFQPMKNGQSLGTRHEMCACIIVLWCLPMRLPSGVWGRTSPVSWAPVNPVDPPPPTILSLWNCPSNTCPLWKTNFPLPCFKSRYHSPMYLEPLEY